MNLVGKASKKKKLYSSTVSRIYLNHPFLIGVFSSSFLIEVIFTAFLKAKLASTTVIVDIRKDSPTFGKYFSCELSAENKLQVFIPRGFAHGYITLSETSIFSYKVDQFYNLESEGSINPEDPSLGIDWKMPQSEWIQSKKDKKHPNLSEAKLFDYNEALYA